MGDESLDAACRGKEDIAPPSTRVLRCLRLDGPLNANPGTCPPPPASTSYVNWGAGAGTHHTQPGENEASDQVTTTFHAAHVRPHSPKGDAAREIRRKKSDRQKSAINVDEVLRSVGGIRNSFQPVFFVHYICRFTILMVKDYLVRLDTVYFHEGGHLQRIRELDVDIDIQKLGGGNSVDVAAGEV
ncbi:unnamed protein product [Echinostoma caproni]|uniref:Costars domain-containing protein n=1 Tax=Echinostoma caproni TaxID=27848 RepID=A0A183AB81_9TREM|nr:unnamed protein product [Echinostoma caproni]